MRSRTDVWLDFIWRRHRLVLALAALVTLFWAGLATRLELRTNVAELLPSKDPAVEQAAIRIINMLRCWRRSFIIRLLGSRRHRCD